jgi:hypothetical protein
LSVTSLHSAKGKGAEKTPGPTPTLAQLVDSIGTSKVTKDSEDKSDKEEEDDKVDGSSASKQDAIDGMDILHGNGKHGATLFSTAWMEETKRQARVRDTWKRTLLGERSQIAPRKTNGRRKKRRNPISQQK